MTRARALKTIIRARAAKTGERYTTARRHVLNELVPAPVVRSPSRSAAAPAQSRTAAAPATTKGALSDAKAREKTGHGLEHWFGVLDRFGGVAKGHTALARHLYDDHAVPGWYSQGITVAYERARGARAANQRCDGAYEVSVSKVMNATTADVVEAMTDPKRRRRWMKDLDAALVTALAAGVEGPGARNVVVRADGQGRFRYKWGDTIVQFYLLPKPAGRVSVVVTNSKLADGGMVEERRASWRAALNAIAAQFAGA
jgi:uncharacterized protein YndB with AHSA1/START domain